MCLPDPPSLAAVAALKENLSGPPAGPVRPLMGILLDCTMSEDYFEESVPDGIANAIFEILPETECCGQDGYELLTLTFGEGVDGQTFKAFTDQHCQEMAQNIQSYFELDEPVSVDQGRFVIESALNQWGG